MIKKILATLCLAGALQAQCQLGIHPQSVTSLPGQGCNEVTAAPNVWASMSHTIHIGDDISFNYFNPPHLSNLCPPGFGYTLISLNYIPGGIQITAGGCRAYVPPDLIFQHLVPMCNGCHSVLWIDLPNNPVFIGLTLNAQTVGIVLTPGLKVWAGQPIQFTVQP